MAFLERAVRQPYRLLCDDEINQIINSGDREAKGTPQERLSCGAGIGGVRLEGIVADGILTSRSSSSSSFGNLTSIVVDFSGCSLPRLILPTLTEAPAGGEFHESIENVLRYGSHSVWYRVVAGYAERNPTFAIDKLPALAGIASRVHSVTKDKYIAGHWGTDLMRSLFWQPVYGGGRRHRGRPKIYIAPTESWASINQSALCDTNGSSKYIDLENNIRILNIDVTVKGQNPFGRVLDTRLTVQTKVIRAA